ncbi:MAG TPA: hypothetical protein VGR28_03875, partial [Candidatus Thermoplasmatota archaeon]|nr:hypothetical protein [Candidatus Thermoplasmatota archaeon]
MIARPASIVVALLALGALAGAADADPRWDDATLEAGIAYKEAGELHKVPTDPHEVPQLDWPAFPEIIGGGVCWADVDNDGYEDAYLVNQRFNQQNPNYGAWADGVDTRSRLFLNGGDGTFTDATDGSGADAG